MGAEREEEEDEEELMDLTALEKDLDPLYHAVVEMAIGDTLFIGHVQDIVCRKTTKERFYLAEDKHGDLEILTRDQ
eukprot:14356635-Alexandrium_andersonii.AAC.1